MKSCCLITSCYFSTTGFIPQTVDGHGDPLAILVLMHQPLPPMTVLEAQSIGDWPHPQLLCPVRILLLSISFGTISHMYPVVWYIPVPRDSFEDWASASGTSLLGLHRNFGLEVPSWKGKGV
jgi:hypothetical protein